MASIIGKGLTFDDVSIIPKYNKILTRDDVDLETKVTRNHKIKIPLLAANMDTICDSRMAIALGKLGGLGVIHRFLTIEKQAEEVDKVKKEGLLAAAAIGVTDVEKRASALIEARADILVIDIAHGHSKYAGKTLDYLKKNYPYIDVMAGNIVTKDAAEYFFTKKADAVKVGIGPGSLCTTRLMTGVGIPQITAIMNVYEFTKGRIPICADGGVEKPADLVKALVAGADNIMGGFIFAGTLETPGEIIKKRGKEFKLYRGSASYDIKEELNEKKNRRIKYVEGVKTEIHYQGSIQPIVDNFLDGLRSAMTYVGAKDMEALIGVPNFIMVTNSGIREGEPHALFYK